MPTSPQHSSPSCPHADLVAIDTLAVYCHGSVARPLAGLHWLLGELASSVALERRARGVDGRTGLQRFPWIDEVHAVVQGREDGRAPREGGWDPLRAVAAAADRAGFGRLVAEVRALLAPDAEARLTPRQRNVLSGLARGSTYERIAAELGFSHGTIRKEAIAIYRALEVHGRDEAVAIARRVGLSHSSADIQGDAS